MARKLRIAMEQTTSTPATTPADVDPMKFTQEKLSEIGKVWMTFAKNRVEAYSEKLPAAVRKVLEPKSDMPSDGESAGSGAA